MLEEQPGLHCLEVKLERLERGVIVSTLVERSWRYSCQKETRARTKRNLDTMKQEMQLVVAENIATKEYAEDKILLFL